MNIDKGGEGVIVSVLVKYCHFATILSQGL